MENNTDSKELIWSMFDYIGVVCFTGYQTRVIALKKELERVGLIGRVNFHWDFPNPFEERLKASLRFQNERTRKAFNCGYNNYCIIKTAYELGKHNVLVLEDDVRFLKSLNNLKMMMAALPQDYDLAMLDKNWPSLEYMNRECILSRKKNDYWIEFDKFFSSGCYAMSRKGMERFLATYEKKGLGTNNIEGLKSNDQYFNRESLGHDLKLYAAQPNICCQGYIADCLCPTDLTGYWNRLEGTNMEQRDYELYSPIVTAGKFQQLLIDYVNNQEHTRTFSRVFCPQNTYLVQSGIDAEVTDQLDNQTISHVSVWGNRESDGNRLALQTAIQRKATVLLTEDGFIRSLNTWVGNYNNTLNKSHSVLFDSRAYYFDATKASDIENLLNDFNLRITPEQRVEARRLINKIVSNKVSKYNHQPIVTPSIGREGKRKVLIVDQSYGDFSIAKGMADDTTFEKMLEAAINENPDADILVKTHPDTIAGKKAERKGYYQDLVEHDNIYKVTFPINPYSLLEVCDKVYVCSSQFGFEALMAGKEVHVFGMPFYAGWGLTIDNQHLARRTNMRTLEEVFYIFYCMYTHWVDPDKGCGTTLDAVIDKMIRLRDQYKSAKIVERTPCLEDGFGYRSPSNNFRASGLPSPSVSTRAHICVFPRIKR